MRRFLKTLAGKTITFVVCVISICLLAASVAGIFLYAQYGMFYRLSEEALTDTILKNEQLEPYGFTILWNELSGTPDVWDDEYQITDEKGRVIAESERFQAVDTPVYTLFYGVLRDESGNLTDIYYRNNDGLKDPDGEYYTVALSLTEGFPVAMQVHLITSAIHAAYALRYAVYFIAVASLLLAIACFVALLYASGRRPDSDELFPGALHRIPFDLLLALCILIGIGLCYLGEALLYSWIYDSWIVAFGGIAALCLVGLNLALGLGMSAAGRIKQHTFLKNTVICHCMRLVWKILCCIGSLLKKVHGFNLSLLRGLPLIWKTGLVFCGVSVLELLVLAATGGSEELILVWFVEKVVVLPCLLYLALTLRRLQKSGAALANGDLCYHTDTKGMLWDFKQHGEHLNSIADGMAIAVEERMKSERMKTELITNVSHDIKTPLTSIINYATLIGREVSENPNITEYAGVLVRQSEKLKRLIEDLVEASKASTGNLEVVRLPCDAAVFLTQAGGEYEEKLQQAGLTLITKLPEKELRILADGRRMWRIFDNLMNNICKYAQSGTRVYLSLEEQKGNAVITFKNTSREPLNLSEEELMERFTRGDSSRNSEGNGLGLSIAGSLAELQGGSLRLAVDGDLFKAILSFPVL